MARIALMTASVLWAVDLPDDGPDHRGRARHAGRPPAVRAVLVHMIEEYARHNGHADLLRETIDGRVGQ